MAINITDDNVIVGEIDEDVDPINDIIDYLVRCAKISFKNAHVDENMIKTSEKISIVCNIFKRSPTEFLMQFGKYLASYHLQYFEKLHPNLPNEEEIERFNECITRLKEYHSDDSKHKRTRNRRYKALQKLQQESDYFSEKQMMYRNPLLYEQLVGQFLTDEEIVQRDGVDRENLTFLNMILETVDRNQMRQTKNEQMLEEDQEVRISPTPESNNGQDGRKNKQWGNFDVPDTSPSFTPEARKQTMISAPERKLLREEFLQEMYSSFIEGRDMEVDYNNIDNDEQYDDLLQLSQDAEDKYFDSETNEVDNLEEHMKLIQEYGRKDSNSSTAEDPLDVFMQHISVKQNSNYPICFNYQNTDQTIKPLSTSGHKFLYFCIGIKNYKCSFHTSNSWYGGSGMVICTTLLHL